MPLLLTPLKFREQDMVEKKRLSASITEKEFDNRDWYAAELRRFAVKMRIPSADAAR